MISFCLGVILKVMNPYSLSLRYILHKFWEDSASPTEDGNQ